MQVNKDWKFLPNIPGVTPKDIYELFVIRLTRKKGKHTCT